MKLLLAAKSLLGLNGPRLGLRVQVCSSTLLKCIVMLTIMNVVSGCGPGGRAGRRRGVHKLTPLVFKQHVPNLSENNAQASGKSEGKILRDDPKFQKLTPNYNKDIIFKDEEGTAADRFMTERCKEKVNMLAISVMNQWPGVKLRVTEGWDQDNHHAEDSLHYEGRAVDITTSDRDRSKYGMLAKLAVEAGFDWVYYESKSHIHCSVKSESSSALKSGGCFHGDTKIKTKTGYKQLSSIEIGEEVEVLDDTTGQMKYSEVILFLDRNPYESRHFIQLETSSNKTLVLTPSHLIYVLNNPKSLETNCIKCKNKTNSVTSVSYNNLVIIFAQNLKNGDYVLTSNSDKTMLDRVTHISTKVKQGVYAPLTKEGSIVVNNIVASCYAFINSHTLAHISYAPLRLYYNFEKSVKRLYEVAVKPLYIITLKTNTGNTYEPQSGIHWYASILYDIAYYILPENMFYKS